LHTRLRPRAEALMRRLSFGVTIVFGAIAILLQSESTFSQGRRPARFGIENLGTRAAAAREILIKFRDQPQAEQLRQLIADLDAEGVEPVGRTGILRVFSRTRSAAALRAALASRADLAFAEPNYIVSALSNPSDPLYPQLWALKNTGQSVNGAAAGTAGADMKAADAWSVTVGSASNVVAIVDTGIDYTHGDLAPNMWSAPSAFTVTIGGVAITCEAGTHGFNAIARTCDPMDDHNHGTHVAGTIGAVGNNANGVVGVNWVTSMMGLKFLDASGSGTVADAIDAIDFAVQVKEIFASSGGANIRVLSNSWGGGDFSQALLNQINEAGDADMLFVAAAGNNGLPNDLIPMYPASYAAPNLVAVAATTNTDARASFSNYGAKSVHLGAPGVNILSSVRGGGYGFSSGTSMATPHVSGAAALTLSQCALDTPSLKLAVVDSVDPVPSMATTTISGGRLNVRRALQSCSEPPGVPSNLTALGGDRQIKLNWSAADNATGYLVKRSTVSGGPYATVASIKVRQFTDTGLTNGTKYYYVVSAVNLLGESAPSTEASATPKLPADVVVSALTVPGDVAAGSQVTFAVTTKNQGTGSADPSTTRFFMSTNAVWDAADTPLAESQAVPTLAPGALAPDSVTVTIPSTLVAGGYYVIAKADAYDGLFESNESNNNLARSIDVGPDLTVSKLTLPTVAAPGSAVDANFTIKNSGASSAGPSSVAFYWSTNTGLDSSDSLLTSVNIGSVAANGGTLAGQATMTVPSDAVLGTYYVIALADAANVVPESSETNNKLFDSVRVGGDLVVSAFSIPSVVGAGVPFVVTDSTSNSGTAGVDSSLTHFYLSTDAALSPADPLIGTRAVNGLSAGQTSTGDTTLTIPSGMAAGTYYLFAKADGDNTVTETQENNNTSIKSVKVGPDLVVTITSATNTVAGSTTAVTDTVTNRGGNDAAPSIVRYYLSANILFDAGDVPLAETRAVGIVAPDGTSTGTTAVRIPAGTTPGYYYVIAQADGAGAVLETSETNNTSPKKIKVD